MARTSITASSSNVTSDTGSTDITYIKGEQYQISVTIKYLTTLADTKVTATFKEANNVNLDGEKPTEEKEGAAAQYFNILADPANTGGDITLNSGEYTFPSNYSTNKFLLSPDETSANGWVPQPTPGDDGRVYGFWELKVKDSGSGDAQQVNIPLRGLFIVRYGVGG